MTPAGLEEELFPRCNQLVALTATAMRWGRIVRLLSLVESVQNSAA